MGAVDRRPALLVEIGLEFLEGRAALLRLALELGAELRRPIDRAGAQIIVPVADLADPLRLAAAARWRGPSRRRAAPAG